MENDTKYFRQAPDQPFTVLSDRRNLLSLVYTKQNNEITGSRKSKRHSVSIDMSIV